MTKVISLLGATGSIGRQTLQVARELGLGVAALTANRQIDLLEQKGGRAFPLAVAGVDPRGGPRSPGRCGICRRCASRRGRKACLRRHSCRRQTRS